MNVSVRHLEHLEFSFAPWPWPFAQERRSEIDEFFRRECEKNPALWNGRLLLLRDPGIAGGTLSGSFFETDYASMVAALAWDAMEERVKSCFPAAAIVTADGAFILGEMAEYTYSGGRILFPCGSVERADVAGAQVNVCATLRRELLEETGIAADSLSLEPGWYAVAAGPLLALVKVMRAAATAEEFRRRICANLAAQERPELRDVVVVRGRSDISIRMPSWVTAFLGEAWSSAGRPSLISIAGATRRDRASE